MDDVEAPHEEIDIADRLMAAAMGILALGGTAFLGPVLLAVITKGFGAKFLVLALFSHPAQYLIGLCVFVVFGLVAGIVLGTRRTVSMLGHLWLTERPAKPLISAAMWGSLALIWWLAYVEALHAI